MIGEYKILLKRNNLNIFIYLNEDAKEDGSRNEDFDLIYSELKGKVLISEMNNSSIAKYEDDDRMNHYYIFIERYLSNSEVRKIVREYKKGNINSKYKVEYDLEIDNEEQPGNGIYDDFELYEGIAADPAFYPPNLNFFKTKYLK